MAITSTGLGSGLDVEGIVSKLMAIERQPLSKLAVKEASFQAKLTAYGTLNGAVSSFQSASSSLASTNLINQVTSSSSDNTVVGVTSTSIAKVGSYTIETSQLAAQQQLVATGQSSLTASLGTGTLTFDFGTISGGTFSSVTGQYTGASFTSNGSGVKTVAITAANDSLTGIRDAVNAAGIGVTASIINDGSATPYRLSFTPSSGASNSIKLTVPDNPGGSLDNFISNDPTGTQHLAETTTAKDALFKVNGLSVSQNSNTVTSVISGLTLTLSKTNVGTPATVTVANDSKAFIEAVQSFVSKYNELNSTIKLLTAFDPKDSSKNGLLLGDSTVRSVQSQVRSVMANTVPGLKGSYTTLSSVGLSFQKDGSLKLDESKLQTALTANSSDVTALFASFGRPTDPLISYSSSTSSTNVGSRAVNITTIATQGGAVGVGASGLTITAGVNDGLNVTVDGLSVSVTIAAGTYSQAGLNAAIQSAINGNTSVAIAGSTVAVTDTAGVLRVTSNRYGSTSKVDINGGTAATGLFGAGSIIGTVGVDVAGTIDGAAATGSRQSLTSIDGLVISVNGGATGARGTIEFARGYGYLLSTLASGYLGTTGTISSKTDGVNRSIDAIGNERVRINTRLTATEKRLRAQFTALDGTVASLNATSNFLTQQLNALNNSKSK